MPSANIGVATGEISGAFVLDIDGVDAAEHIRKLEACNTDLPPTLQVCTPGGPHRLHRWFKMPPGVEIRNSEGKIAPKVDIRGTGGYALVPPSVHPSGRRYTWSVDSANTIADPPTWLIELIAAPAHTPAKPAEHWRHIVNAGVDQGARNSTATQFAGHLLRHNVDPLVVLELLLCWNAQHCRPPLPAEDIERIVDSIAGRELRRRGGG
jgi:hypothetical protein